MKGLAPGQLLAITLALGAADVSKDPAVVGASPLIDIRQNAAATSVDTDVLDRFPGARDYTSVAGLGGTTPAGRMRATKRRQIRVSVKLSF